MEQITIKDKTFANYINEYIGTVMNQPYGSPKKQEWMKHMRSIKRHKSIWSKITNKVAWRHIFRHD